MLLSCVGNFPLALGLGGFFYPPRRNQMRHRVAFEGENVYTQHPPRRTLMDVLGQSCCILFPFVDILCPSTAW